MIGHVFGHVVSSKHFYVVSTASVAVVLKNFNSCGLIYVLSEWVNISLIKAGCVVILYVGAVLWHFYYYYYYSFIKVSYIFNNDTNWGVKYNFNCLQFRKILCE